MREFKSPLNKLYSHATAFNNVHHTEDKKELVYTVAVGPWGGGGGRTQCYLCYRIGVMEPEGGELLV